MVSLGKKCSILSSEEQQSAVQRQMGHKHRTTTLGYITELSDEQIRISNSSDSKEIEKSGIKLANIRASQLKPIEECVQKCVQIAKKDFKL